MSIEITTAAQAEAVRKSIEADNEMHAAFNGKTDCTATDEKVAALAAWDNERKFAEIQLTELELAVCYSCCNNSKEWLTANDSMRAKLGSVTCDDYLAWRKRQATAPVHRFGKPLVPGCVVEVDYDLSCEPTRLRTLKEKHTEVDGVWWFTNGSFAADCRFTRVISWPEE